MNNEETITLPGALGTPQQYRKPKCWAAELRIREEDGAIENLREMFDAGLLSEFECEHLMKFTVKPDRPFYYGNEDRTIVIRSYRQTPTIGHILVSQGPVRIPRT